MSGLDGARSELADALARLDRESEESRSAWNDEARALFDSRYGDRIRSEGAAAVAALVEAEQEMQAVARMMQST